MEETLLLLSLQLYFHSFPLLKILFDQNFTALKKILTNLELKTKCWGPGSEVLV